MEIFLFYKMGKKQGNKKRVGQFDMFPWKYFSSTKWERSKEIKRESWSI
jgi:hypothetical protein